MYSKECSCFRRPINWCTQCTNWLDVGESVFFFPVGNWQKKGPFMDLGISHLLGRSFIKLNNMNKIDSDGVLTSHRMRKRPPPRQRAGEAASAGSWDWLSWYRSSVMACFLCLAGGTAMEGRGEEKRSVVLCRLAVYVTHVASCRRFSFPWKDWLRVGRGIEESRGKKPILGPVEWEGVRGDPKGGAR